MKIIPILVLTTIFALGCANNDLVQTEDVDISGYDKVVMTVHGLSCPLCSHNLDGVIGKLEGVENVEIDLETGEVAVDLGPNHSLTSSRLRKAVKDSGFTMKSIRPEA